MLTGKKVELKKKHRMGQDIEWKKCRLEKLSNGKNVE
jgi:hypothetical protein